MAIHPPDCNCVTLGCVLRRGGGIQVPPSATPTRTRRFVPRQPRYMSWEAGVAGEHRPDGSFMPAIDGTTGDRIGIKRWSEEPALRVERRDQVSAPAPLTPRST